MEIINNNTDDQQQPKDVIKAKNIYIGSILILCGIIWMSYNLEFISYGCFHKLFSWQTLVMALGGYFMALRKWSLGAVTFGIGFIFALGEWLELNLPIKDIILPAILIAAGIVIILQYLSKK